MNTTLSKLRADVIVRELGNRNIKLIAHISPQSAKHLIVELAWLIISHQACGLLESLGGNLVGLLTTHSCDVGIVDSTLAEDDKQSDEHQNKGGDGDPIGC